MKKTKAVHLCPVNNSAPGKQGRSGFTLVEIIMAVGIVAIAIPAILGIFAIFSSVSKSIVGLEDSAAAVSSFQLYMDGAIPDGVNGSAVSFDTVYGWAYAARQDEADATVLYAYRTSIDKPEYYVSQTVPTTVAGPLIAAKIYAPAETLVSDAVLVEAVADYAKYYLPLRLDIFAPSKTGQTEASDLVKSYPLVLSR